MPHVPPLLFNAGQVAYSWFENSETDMIKNEGQNNTMCENVIHFWNKKGFQQHRQCLDQIMKRTVSNYIGVHKLLDI